MKIYIAWLFTILLVSTPNCLASELEKHFLGEDVKCIAKPPVPVLIVADVTRAGEIDDSISLYVYSRLEKAGCIKVIGVASIFGNGGSTTLQAHENLVVRLGQLGLTSWPVFLGPLNKVPFEVNWKLTATDTENLEKIAAHIIAYDKVVIAELGPLTVSACLMRSKMISQANVVKILGVGGRAEGEHFSQGGVPFSFRDMNVAEDRMAMKYLLEHYASKLWMTTYRTGIGARMIGPEMVSDIGNDDLMAHAYKRAKMLKKIGYQGKIPSWDTWTTSWFLKGGPEKLGCKKMWAKMAHAEKGYRPTDSMQLRLMDDNAQRGNRIEACHEVSE